MLPKTRSTRRAAIRTPHEGDSTWSCSDAPIRHFSVRPRRRALTSGCLRSTCHTNARSIPLRVVQNTTGNVTNFPHPPALAEIVTYSTV